MALSDEPVICQNVATAKPCEGVPELVRVLPVVEPEREFIQICVEMLGAQLVV